ncbi:hypothetical protein Tco_1156709 [Tanacetum coccineum]
MKKDPNLQVMMERSVDKIPRNIELPDDLNMPALEEYSIFDFIRDDEDDGVVAEMNNLDTTIQDLKIQTFLIEYTRLKRTVWDNNQAPRAWYETLSTYLLDNEFQRGKIDKTLFIKRYKGRRRMSYVLVKIKMFGEILKNLVYKSQDYKHYPMKSQKPLLKEEDGKRMDVPYYRFILDSMMYLTSSSADIMFASGRINAIDADEDITLVNDQDDADMFDVNTLTGDEVKGDVVEELSVPVSVATTTTTATILTPKKGIIITELEERSNQFDEQEAIKLQAEFDEEERLAREKDEANVALTEEWDDIQAKVDVDY